MVTAGARVLPLKDHPERLLDGAKASIERMPMLHVIFERTASQCSESLRQLLPSPALFSVESIATERVGDVIDGHDGDAVIGVVYVQAWESRLLIGLDNDFIFALADGLFGGDGSEQPSSEQPPLSNIELRLAEKAFDLVGKALQSGFATIWETTFRLDRIETQLDFVVIAPRTAFGVKARIKVRILGREIGIFILIPQTALNSVRQELERDPSAEMSIRDPRWSKQLQDEVGRTDVIVRGVIEDRHLTLGDIAGLRAGQLLTLQANAKTKVRIECNGEPLFFCDLGQADGFVRIQKHMRVPPLRGGRCSLFAWRPFCARPIRTQGQPEGRRRRRCATARCIGRLKDARPWDGLCDGRSGERPMGASLTSHGASRHAPPFKQ